MTEYRKMLKYRLDLREGAAMWAYKRFLNYVKIWTTSERNSPTVPSSLRQFDLAHLLAFQLRELGLADVEVNNFGIVYAKLPATPGYEQKTKLGFIAHLDTHPDFNGKDVRPQVIENYDGSDVPLGTSGLVLRVSDHPHLSQLKGDTLITTDGTSLLGGDDKAGIAEIITALEYIITKNIPHGSISIAFMPDEEIGNGTKNFDIERFGAQYAYTIDGWVAGEIVYENFNASQVTLQIQGRTTHTGKAKNKMINAQLVGMQINSLLPPNEIPAKTEGTEGFYHLLSSHGNVTNATLVYAVRDHDDVRFQKRLDTLSDICEQMNRQYVPGTVSMTVKDEYRNMRSVIEPCFHLIEHAKAATRAAGIEPKICPSRGGTDGARLSFMGLPCPNIGTGGHAYHGPMEHITAEVIESVTRIIVEIIRSYADAKL